jgi:hypothetical protein
MSQFNLSDIQSSTLLLSSDSLDEVLDVVLSLIQTEGPDGLTGLTLSLQDPESNEFQDYDNEKILKALQTRKETVWAKSGD